VPLRATRHQTEAKSPVRRLRTPSESFGSYIPYRQLSSVAAADRQRHSSLSDNHSGGAKVPRPHDGSAIQAHFMSVATSQAGLSRDPLGHFRGRRRVQAIEICCGGEAERFTGLFHTPIIAGQSASICLDCDRFLKLSRRFCRSPSLRGGVERQTDIASPPKKDATTFAGPG
jgi:hypothetical protein